MSYEKYTWVNGESQVNAPHLNHIEQGIYDLDQNTYSKTEVDGLITELEGEVVGDGQFLVLSGSTLGVVPGHDTDYKSISIQNLNVLGFPVESWDDVSVLSVQQGTTAVRNIIYPQYYVQVEGSDVYPCVKIVDDAMRVYVYNTSAEAGYVYWRLLLMKITDLPHKTML